MSGDHLVFISVSAVLIVSAINTVVLNRQHGWRQSDTFWFWGLIALSVSYLAFGSSAWFGRPALTLANASLLIAYLAVSLQLRYWKTGKTNTPIWYPFGAVIYIMVLEYLRVSEPYLIRVTLIHVVLSIITAYLFTTSISYYKQHGSKQLLVLSTTFAIEFLCASSRLVIAVTIPALTNQPMTLYDEPMLLVVLRWIWLIANAMSFLTIMTFELEKTLNKNELLQGFLKEKNLLLNALSRLNRGDKTAAIGRTLSHELRQPLTTAMLAANNLRAQIARSDYSNLTEQLDVLCLESARSTRLINQLEAVFQPPRQALEQTMLDRAVANAVDLLKPRLLDLNVELNFHGDCHCTVMGESLQIETIFINLISNSVNALVDQPGERHIDVYAQQDGRTCAITVRDNGPGIAASILPYLWEPYVTDSQTGSGVGLWLSQQIARNHGGFITAGNAPGSGAWFRVVLLNAA